MPLKSLLILLLALGPGALRASANATQMLQSGWMRLEVEGQWDSRVLQEKVGSLIQDVGQVHRVFPVRIYLGGGDGIQGVLQVPVVWNSLQKSTGTITTGGVGDLAAGIKVKLLEDTGTTPAFFIETLLKFPTGLSAFETYVLERTGEDNRRGTGSGSFDLDVSAIVSAYLRPFETYLILELDQRGSNELVVDGIPRRVDYGHRSSVVAGLEMDLGSHLSLALESRADVYSADVWTEGGDDMTSGLGSDLKLFRDEALAEADLHLGTVTEWYVGPRLDWKFLDGSKLSVRGEAGLTPDTPNWRLTASLSSVFNTRLRFGKLFDRKKAAAPGSRPVAGEGADWASLPPGNLQRYIYTRYEDAEKAAARGDDKRLASILTVLEELHPVPVDLRPKIAALSDRLFVLASQRYQDGLAAEKKGRWAEAVRAWRDALDYRPGFDPAAKALSLRAKDIQEASDQLFKQGIDLYVGGDPAKALQLWEQALELQPGDEKIQASIDKARKKITALKKLK